MQPVWILLGCLTGEDGIQLVGICISEQWLLRNQLMPVCKSLKNIDFVIPGHQYLMAPTA